MTQQTGANGATAAFTYDTLARPASTTSPTGAVTTTAYSADGLQKWVTTNGRSTVTTSDGLGRVIRVEQLDQTGTKSLTYTEYLACACAAAGKVWRVSSPVSAPWTPIWTTYAYDGLGRVTSVTHPGGTGVTTYVYVGNQVTVTDPKGNWKRFTLDSFGQLTQVTEPNPAGGANLETYYGYNWQGKLTAVVMTRGGVTQTRTFVYDSNGRLVSQTLPESGTTTYGYVGQRLAWKVDAKGQKVAWNYDIYGRVTQIDRYGDQYGQPEAGQGTTFSYDAGEGQNLWGRLAKMK